jgi:hypothetical protein
VLVIKFVIKSVIKSVDERVRRVHLQRLHDQR